MKFVQKVTLETEPSLTDFWLDNDSISIEVGYFEIYNDMEIYHYAQFYSENRDIINRFKTNTFTDEDLAEFKIFNSEGEYISLRKLNNREVRNDFMIVLRQLIVDKINN